MGEKLMNSIEDISVVDVYELASDIGKECEKIIDLFGAEAVTSLMPKVINALELLEALATRNENENTKLQMLNDRVAYLESEKLEKAAFRERFQKELEVIEEQWHSETKDLAALVNRLQEENRRINNKYQGSPVHGDEEAIGAKDVEKAVKLDSTANLMNASDFQKMQRLRVQMEKQRDDIKCKDQEIEEKNYEIENISIQLERLKLSGRESRKRQKLLQAQVRMLIEERADFLVQLKDQNREINVLRRSLGFAEHEIESEVSSKNCTTDKNNTYGLHFSTDELKQLLNEKDDMKQKIRDLESKLTFFQQIITTEGATIDDEPSLYEIPSLNIIDEESDPPVQGPMPCEPDDAPWKKRSNETGVRKFFRKLFAEQSTSSFPRRSISTLLALSASPSRSAAI